MKIIDILNTDKMSLSFEVFPPKKETSFESVKAATEEIAASCGITDASYFNKVFRKAEGMTASQYRSTWKGRAVNPL